jgi:hypothetical protein
MSVKMPKAGTKPSFCGRGYSMRLYVTHINHTGMARINGPESKISGKEIF